VKWLLRKEYFIIHIQKNKDEGIRLILVGEKEWLVIFDNFCLMNKHCFTIDKSISFCGKRSGVGKKLQLLACDTRHHL
jgi:hypothetical protein